MAAIVEVNDGDFDKVMQDIVMELRTKALSQSVRRAGNVVANRAKQLVPVGDVSHKPDDPSLKSTIKVKVKPYNDGLRVVAIVGSRRPQGNHDHLVENGHWIRRRGKKGEGPGEWYGAKVEGKPYLAPAADQTESEQTQAIVDHLRVFAEKHRNG